uniref:Uncharacterized protein n=1 Tax=Meloidogyne floridensis TaxID=298350 RepID=A0A915P5X2_9BILA
VPKNQDEWIKLYDSLQEEERTICSDEVNNKILECKKKDNRFSCYTILTKVDWDTKNTAMQDNIYYNLKQGCGDCYGFDNYRCMHCERRLCNSVYALVREYGLRTCLVDHKVQGAMELCERGVDGCFITHWLKQEGRFWGGCEPIFGTNCDPNRHCYHCEGSNCNTVEKFKEAFYCYIKDNKGNIKLGNVCGEKICY